MVADANTVVDPGAMMVESLNTDIADGTMPGSRGPDDLAVGAQVSRVELLEQVHEVQTRLRLELSSILG